MSLAGVHRDHWYAAVSSCLLLTAESQHTAMGSGAKRVALVELEARFCEDEGEQALALLRGINLCSESPWEQRKEKAPRRKPTVEGDTGPRGGCILMKAGGIRTLSLFFRELRKTFS